MKRFWKAIACVTVLALAGAASAGAAQMITGKQIADATVTGADVKQGTLKTKHLSAGAKQKLAGAQGPAGPAGPAGPQGPAGPKGDAGSADRYAEFDANGNLTGDIKGIEQAYVSHPADGVYCLTFPAGERPMAGAATGVVGDVFATLQIDAEGGISQCPPLATVRVGTFDLGVGAAANRAFRVLLESS